MLLFVKVNKITYKNNFGWGAVASLRKGKTVILNGVGDPPAVSSTAMYQLTGEYIKNPVHGKIFLVSHCQLEVIDAKSLPKHLQENKWRFKYG